MSRWAVLRPWGDRVVAGLVGVVVAPIDILLACLVRRGDGGPGHIGVRRMGRGGRIFAMYKLRTMRAVEVDGSAGGAPLTAGGDPRITPLGRRLRSFRLDEMPQLLNVVRGDMALIGPRPEDPALVDLHDPEWQVILTARPGILGPTQFLVAGWEADLDGGVEAYREQVLPVKKAIDRWYVECATPRIDLTVICAAVRQVTGRSQGPLTTLVEREVPESRRIPA